MPTIASSHPLLNKRLLMAMLMVCFTVLVLGACSTTADKTDKLDRMLRGYEKALRWAKFDMAYSYFKWESGEQAIVPKHLKSIRLTQYRIASRQFDEDTMTATQVVTIKYYNQDNLREKELEDHQKWEYFSDEKRWYLVSQPPAFK